MKKILISLCSIFSLVFFAQAEETVAPVASKIRVPIAQIKESVVCCPREIVIFNGWASIAPGSEIKTWVWDISGDGKPDTTCETGELQIPAPDRYGMRIVKLWVKDNSGTISPPDSTIFHIQKNVINASAGRDIVVKIGDRVNFESIASCCCGKIVEWQWFFSGSEAPEFRSKENGKTSRSYMMGGLYKARFKVIDYLGNEAGGIVLVTVSTDAPKKK